MNPINPTNFSTGHIARLVPCIWRCTFHNVLLDQRYYANRQEGRFDLSVRTLAVIADRTKECNGAKLPSSSIQKTITASPFSGSIPFSTLPLPKELLHMLGRNRFSQSTDIQRAAFAPIRQGKDVVIAAQTGTGKTLAYLLPLLTRLIHERSVGNDSPIRATGADTASLQTSLPRPHHPRAIIVLPTRDLARQTFQTIRMLTETNILRTVGIVGDLDTDTPKALQYPTDILVTVPGRLKTLLDENTLHISDVQSLVLDEADLLLAEFKPDLYPALTKFRHDIHFDHDEDENHLRAQTSPPTRTQLQIQPQLILVGASIASDSMRHLCLQIQNLLVVASEKLHRPPRKAKHEFLPLKGPNRKPDVLLDVCQAEASRRVLIFCNKAATVAWASRFLQENGFRTTAMTAAMTKATKRLNMDMFLSSKANILVCTDIVSRGMNFNVCLVNEKVIRVMLLPKQE